MTSSSRSGGALWSAMLVSLGCFACGGSSMVERIESTKKPVEKYPACPSSDPRVQRVRALAAVNADQALEAWRALRSQGPMSVDDSCAIATALANSGDSTDAVSVLSGALTSRTSDHRDDQRLFELVALIHADGDLERAKFLRNLHGICEY